MDSLKVLSLHFPGETKKIHEEFSSALLVFIPDNETQTGVNVFHN
jgi:hypothetical protein